MKSGVRCQIAAKGECLIRTLPMHKDDAALSKAVSGSRTEVQGCGLGEQAFSFLVNLLPFPMP